MVATALERALRGDAAAVEVLLAEQQPRVYQVALYMMGNPHDAEDLAQEALIRIYRNLPKFKGQAAFSTWASRITVNACLDALRKRKVRPSVSLENMLEAECLPHPQGEGPEESYERTARMEALRAALQQINEEQRIAVILRDIQGMSYEEVAEACGCNLNTVKSRISRGRLALRQQLLRQPELFQRASV